MANDLLLMSCKHCKRWIPLAKYFPSTGLTSREYYPSVPEFIDQHVGCWYKAVYQQGDQNVSDLGGDPQFELHTEDSLPDVLSWDNQEKKEAGDD